ncbi:hypothetical protein Hdeb2414_s0004g00145281 [Helianthus debilis subsp. tardiflorus]
MKKLYNHTKGRRIHPSPPPPPPPPQPSSSTTPNHHLSLLPLTIATLATALSPEDQQVLAYLLSISTGPKPTNNSGSHGDHPPHFNCNCFTCYTSFWARWDASPNQNIIHEIIEVYEDGLVVGNKKNGKSKKGRRSNKSFCSSGVVPAPVSGERVTHAPPEDVEKGICDGGEVDMESSQKGSVRKIVNFVGERIWGVWGV